MVLALRLNMKKDKLKIVLEDEKEKFAHKSYDELCKLKDPIVYEHGSAEDWYQAEVQILEKNDQYVHVSISVDDGKFPKVLKPMSTSFLVYKDGRVDK